MAGGLVTAPQLRAHFSASDIAQPDCSMEALLEFPIAVFFSEAVGH